MTALAEHLHADPVAIDAALARGGLGRPDGVPLDVWLDRLSDDHGDAPLPPPHSRRPD